MDSYLGLLFCSTSLQIVLNMNDCMEDTVWSETEWDYDTESVPQGILQSRKELKDIQKD
jgi:hypothetical protein